MSERSRARTAATATGTAVTLGGQAAGTAAQRAGTALQRAGAVLEEHSTTAGPAVAAGVASGLDKAADVVGSTVGTLADVVTGAVGSTLGGTLGGTVSGLLDEPVVRGGAALDALRGVPVGPPAAVRRWPWALGAAVVGAAAGAGVAVLVHRLQHQDAPGAQEPHELRAVVDLPGDAAQASGEPVEPVATPVPPPA